MKDAPNSAANRFRIRKGPLASEDGIGNNGAFTVIHHGVWLSVIASDEDGWDHVSVSLPYRTPTWEEMSFVKELFFKDEETVIQLHPPRSCYINNHAFCLHLWRKQGVAYELPPAWMVGIRPDTPETPGITVQAKPY